MSSAIASTSVFRLGPATALVFFVALSGCSGTSSQVGPPQSATAEVRSTGAAHDKSGCGQSAPDANSGASFIYTAQLYGNDLKVYSRGGSGLQYDCSFTQGVRDPNGSMTTTNGWWYVANGGGQNVLVYRTKKSAPFGPVSSLTDYNEYPTNVALEPSRQIVAVSNLDSVPSETGGTLAIYLHRQVTPTRTLDLGGTGTYFGAGVAVTRNGDCYWAVNASENGTGTIVRFAACNGKPTTIVSGIPKVGGLALDQSGTLYYVNSVTSTSAPAGVYRCNGSSCGAFAIAPFAEPTNMNFDYHGKDLWVADPGAGYIDEISASDGALEYQYSTGTNDPAFGIAPEPG